MIILRNIEKRRELHEEVLKSYRPLSKEEQREHENEVGAAFRGYETAMKDIIQIIVNGREDGEIMADIMSFILSQLNGKATKKIFRFTEVPTSSMIQYINTTVKKELTEKGKTEEEAEIICKYFIEYPEVRQHIIEKHGLHTIRICEQCGRPMKEGYMVNDMNTYCSEECARTAALEDGWTTEMFDRHLAMPESKGSCVCWTEWDKME